MKRQLAFFIARAQIPIEWIHPKAGDEEDESEVELEPDLQECLFNTKLSPFFREFGKELGVEEAKSLEDVYKSHLENTSELSGTSSFIVTDDPPQDQEFRRISIPPVEISLVLSLMPSSMLVSETTS